MVITKALASRSTSFNINFGDVEVELPGPLLEGIQCRFDSSFGWFRV